MDWSRGEGQKTQRLSRRLGGSRKIRRCSAEGLRRKLLGTCRSDPGRGSGISTALGKNAARCSCRFARLGLLLGVCVRGAAYVAQAFALYVLY